VDGYAFFFPDAAEYGIRENIELNGEGDEEDLEKYWKEDDEGGGGADEEEKYVSILVFGI